MHEHIYIKAGIYELSAKCILASLHVVLKSCFLIKATSVIHFISIIFIYYIINITTYVYNNAITHKTYVNEIASAFLQGNSYVDQIF